MLALHGFTRGPQHLATFSEACHAEVGIVFARRCSAVFADTDELASIWIRSSSLTILVASRVPW